MSKRTDTIRTLFARPPSAELSADNRPAEGSRVAAGAVRSIKDTFSAVEKENYMLRAQLAGVEGARDIRPDDIDPSPFADRFEQADDPAFEALKRSIAERGQEIPVLLRPHPSRPGRYEIAYGHRRVRAARELSQAVRAIVRPLSDDDLAVAQGLENSAREDLSFIERAVFALRLEEAGRERALIQQALAIDKAEASKLISVARAVPSDIVLAIGKAAKTGRPRWLEFAEALKDQAAVKRVRRAIAAEAFGSAPSDARFGLLYAAAKDAGKSSAASSAPIPIAASDGAVLGTVLASKREIRVALSRNRGPSLAAFLARRLPQLLKEFDETPDEAE